MHLILRKKRVEQLVLEKLVNLIVLKVAAEYRHLQLGKSSLS